MQFITSGDRIAVENFTLGDLYTIIFTSGTYINSACIGIGDNFVSFQRNEPKLLFTLNMETAELVSSIDLYAGGTGTNNYNDLTNKPQINNFELVGNKSLSDLGIQSAITEESPLSSSLVSGLGSAAAAESSDFATAAQGALAASAIQSAGTGLTKSGTTLNHSNSVSPKTSESFASITYDAQGHITGSTAATTAQLSALNSGVTSTDVTQIETNKNNILSLTANGGGKNKFNIDTATINASDASYTKNSDGTINVTKSTNTVGQVAMTQAFLGETGMYIISGCPSGGSSNTYEMLIQSGNTVLARDYGGGASVSLTKGTEYQFKVVVRESQTLSNKLFKPMISVEGGDYQPYAMSNAEITAWILAHS